MSFIMPAEWTRHRATWLAWPHEARDWPGKFAAVPLAFAEIVRHLALVETVQMLVEDRILEEKARRLLHRVGVDLRRVEFHKVRTDRSWLRDSAPAFVVATGAASAERSAGASTRGPNTTTGRKT